MATKEHCLAFVQNLLTESSAQGVPLDLFYLQRDLVVAGWMLQGEEPEPNPINEDDWLSLISPIPNSRRREIAKYELEVIFVREGYVKRLGRNSLMFTPEMLVSIISAFADPVYKLNLLEPIPYLDGRIVGGQKHLSGLQFLRYMNQIDLLEANDLSVLFASCFQTAFQSVSVSAPAGEHSSLRQISSTLGSWEFMIITVPSRGTISFEQLKMALVDIGKFETKRSLQRLEPIKTLFISPTIESGEEELIDFPLVYHLWTLSSVRFLHSLGKLMQNYGREPVESAFNNYFPAEPDAKFSSVEGLSRVEDEIKKKTHKQS